MKSHGFPKIYTVGSSEVKDVFNGAVEITEKLDGSCIGFGIVDGELIVRSKNKELSLTKPESMFAGAVAYIKSIRDKLPKDVFFYGECVSKPRHNVLTYKTVPAGFVALFAMVDTGMWAAKDSNTELSSNDDESSSRDAKFHRYDELADWAKVLGMGIVQLLWDKKIPEGMNVIPLLESFLSKESALGGRMEGIVIKNYSVPQILHGRYCPITIAKMVSDDFKEVKVRKIVKADGVSKLDELFDMYRTEARWQKAIQHLEERGELSYNAKDIGLVIQEAHRDLIEECEESFKNALYAMFRKQWLNAATLGAAEYYKKYLLDKLQG